MILQIFSNYIINFEIRKIGLSKSYIFHTDPKRQNLTFPRFYYQGEFLRRLAELPPIEAVQSHP